MIHFLEYDSNDPSKVQTAYRKLSADYQLAIEEMAHTMAKLGYHVVIKEAGPKVLEIEIWLANKYQPSTDLLD